MYGGYQYGGYGLLGGDLRTGFGVPYRVNQPVVVSNAFGDVNGDGTPDHVYLTAVKAEDPSSPYVTQITLNIQDRVTMRSVAIPMDHNGNAGYNPTLFLGDFTGDDVQDILITIDSGGSGAFTFDYIYSFVHNQAQKLFDFNQYNEQNQYTVTYLDQYRVKVVSPATGQTYLIDISNRGHDYLSQIYNADGTLKKPIQGWADGISGFYPVDIDRNGVYEARAYQQLSGLYHADSLGYMVNTLQWDGRKFGILQQWLGIFGTN